MEKRSEPSAIMCSVAIVQTLALAAAALLLDGAHHPLRHGLGALARHGLHRDVEGVALARDVGRRLAIGLVVFLEPAADPVAQLLAAEAADDAAGDAADD